MKTHYTLFKMLLVAALTANSIAGNAQHTVEFLNANNVNAGFGIGGNLFSQIDSGHHDHSDTLAKWQLMEVPKGSNLKAMFTASLWMSSLDAGNNLHCAAQRYGDSGPEFYDGPLVANYDSAYDNFYKRVFKITRSQIAHHQSLGTVVIPSQIDSAILFWPGKGNPYVATNYGVTIGSRLAPFVDLNGDGIYDPKHGDYPDICGDQAVFFVFNDDRGPHNETGGTKLGVEVRGLAEVFVDYSANRFEKQAINNTVFVNYEIENKSANYYHDFFLGMFEDPDLGCYSNDRIGCDTTKNLIFVYNGGLDPPCGAGIKGYAPLNVSTGTKLLNRMFSSFGYSTNIAGGDPQNPNCLDFRNALSGINDSTLFIFPGDPNNPNDWSDQYSGLVANDRRMMGSSNAGDLGIGEIKVFDYAFVTSYDSTATHLTIVDTLKRDADVVQNFFNSIVTCRATHVIPLGLNDAGKETLQVSVYPNPSSSLLFIEPESNMDVAELTDMLGRTVITKTADAKKLSLNVSGLAHGVYLLRVKAGNKTAVKKVVVE